VERLELTDVARKAVGVGSVGYARWTALMLGRDHQDPLFLQMKERRPGAQLLRTPAPRLEGSAEIEQMIPKGLAMYGRLCGWTLARAHARSDDRIAIVAYLSNGLTFARAILEFVNACAVQNDRDYRQLTTAVDSGKLVAQTGL
jgi:Uncharacterized protein conserved in bacteria (DUF2252)